MADTIEVLPNIAPRLEPSIKTGFGTAIVLGGVVTAELLSSCASAPEASVSVVDTLKTAENDWLGQTVTLPADGINNETAYTISAIGFPQERPDQSTPTVFQERYDQNTTGPNTWSILVGTLEPVGSETKNSSLLPMLARYSPDKKTAQIYALIAQSSVQQGDGKWFVIYSAQSMQNGVLAESEFDLQVTFVPTEEDLSVGSTLLHVLGGKGSAFLEKLQPTALPGEVSSPVDDPFFSMFQIALGGPNLAEAAPEEPTLTPTAKPTRLKPTAVFTRTPTRTPVILATKEATATPETPEPLKESDVLFLKPGEKEPVMGLPDGIELGDLMPKDQYLDLIHQAGFPDATNAYIEDVYGGEGSLVAVVPVGGYLYTYNGRTSDYVLFLGYGPKGPVIYGVSTKSFFFPDSNTKFSCTLWDPSDVKASKERLGTGQCSVGKLFDLAKSEKLQSTLVFMDIALYADTEYTGPRYTAMLLGRNDTVEKNPSQTIYGVSAGGLGITDRELLADLTLK